MFYIFWEIFITKIEYVFRIFFSCPSSEEGACHGSRQEKGASHGSRCRALHFLLALFSAFFHALHLLRKVQSTASVRSTEKSRHFLRKAQLFKIQEFKRCVTINYCYLQSFKSPALQERAKQGSSPEKTRHITFKKSLGLYFTHSFCDTIKFFRRK